MRKLIKRLFYVPKHEKISEKAMLVRITTTITIVIICLVSMSVTAYAYFSYNITSGSNIIKAANFEVNVTITDSNNDPVTVTKDGKFQVADLSTGTYTVELTKGTSTAQTGFCVITIGDTNYHTQQIGVDVERNLTDAKVKFTLNVSSDIKMKILSHWGTSSCYGYEDASNNPIYIESGKPVNIKNTDSTSE